MIYKTSASVPLIPHTHTIRPPHGYYKRNQTLQGISGCLFISLTRQVVIVGAGPSGLLLGLRLARENINVTLVDMGDKLDTQPRATHYAAPAVQEMRKAGIMAEVRARGFTPDGVCWRKIDRTYLAGISMEGVKDDPDAMACLPLNKLGQVLVEHISNYSCANILWSHEVIGIEQDDKAARVTCKTPNGEVTLEGDYVVGCDGANSKVRRSLFGDWEFPGKTWEEQIVATNVLLIDSVF